MSILASYETTERKPADLRLTVDYSEDEDHKLELSCLVENNADKGNYTYRISGSHPATNLKLLAVGGVFWKPRWYYVHHLTDYQRTYLPLQSGEASARLELDKNEIELMVGI